MGDTPINHAAVKAVSAVGVFATIDLWTTVGKVCAATYSVAILAEWLWKRIFKPLALHYGWVRSKSVIIRDGE